MSESRLILNGNALSARQKAKASLQNATVGEAEEIAVRVCEHYMQFVPEMVHKVILASVPQIVAQMLKAQGIELQPPPVDTKVSENTGEYPPIASNPTDSEGPE